MPQYFFDLYDSDVALDPDGIDLADERAARVHATREARAMAAESVRAGHLVGEHRIEIRANDGAIIGRIRFDEAVQIG